MFYLIHGLDPGCDCNKWVLRISQGSSITETSWLGHRTFIEVLLFPCRGAVGVFCRLHQSIGPLSKDDLSMILIGWKIVFLTFWGRRDFVDYFGLWSRQFFAAIQILSSEKYEKILKLARKRRLVDECKNADKELCLLFHIKINTFWGWKSIEFP